MSRTHDLASGETASGTAGAPPGGLSSDAATDDANLHGGSTRPSKAKAKRKTAGKGKGKVEGEAVRPDVKALRTFCMEQYAEFLAENVPAMVRSLAGTGKNTSASFTLKIGVRPDLDYGVQVNGRTGIPWNGATRKAAFSELPDGEHRDPKTAQLKLI